MVYLAERFFEGRDYLWRVFDAAAISIASLGYPGIVGWGGNIRPHVINVVLPPKESLDSSIALVIIDNGQKGAL